MLKIKIESDGTKEGTKLKINGADTEIDSLHFGTDGFSKDIWFNYTIKQKDKNNKMTVNTNYSYDPSIAAMTKKDEFIADDEIDFNDFSKM